MLGHMARGELLALYGALRACHVRQRRGRGLGDERGARAMLRASAAVDLVVIMGMRRGRMLVLTVVVVSLQLQRALLAAGSANADRDGSEAAQRNQREHRADQQQLKSAFHGPGC